MSLRAAVGIVLALMFAIGGWVIGLGAISVALAMLLLCLGFDGARGERIWLRLTLISWVVVLLMAWQPGTECGPEAPNHCGVGR